MFPRKNKKQARRVDLKVEVSDRGRLKIAKRYCDRCRRMSQSPGNSGNRGVFARIRRRILGKTGHRNRRFNGFRAICMAQHTIELAILGN